MGIFKCTTLLLGYMLSTYKHILCYMLYFQFHSYSLKKQKEKQMNVLLFTMQHMYLKTIWSHTDTDTNFNHAVTLSSYCCCHGLYWNNQRFTYRTPLTACVSVHPRVYSTISAAHVGFSSEGRWNIWSFDLVTSSVTWCSSFHTSSCTIYWNDALHWNETSFSFSIIRPSLPLTHYSTSILFTQRMKAAVELTGLRWLCLRTLND